MTLVADRTGNEVRGRNLTRQLGLIQAGRYARHPLFLVSVGAATLVTITGTSGASETVESINWIVAPAFFFGVLGLVVANRLTTSEARPGEVLDATPVPRTSRTLGLLLASWIPMVAALMMLVALLTVFAVNPFPTEVVETAGGWRNIWPYFLESTLVAAFGASALGVAVGRWLRFPAAGAIAAIVLVVSEFAIVGFSLGQAGLDRDSVVMRAIGVLAPWNEWVVVDCPRASTTSCFVDGVRQGSPWAHLLYATSLGGLAAWAAVMKDAEGEVRARWTRIGGGLVAAAAVTLVWAYVG